MLRGDAKGSRMGGAPGCPDCPSVGTVDWEGVDCRRSHNGSLGNFDTHSTKRCSVTSPDSERPQGVLLTGETLSPGNGSLFRGHSFQQQRRHRDIIHLNKYETHKQESMYPTERAVMESVPQGGSATGLGKTSKWFC